MKINFLVSALILFILTSCSNENKPEYAILNNAELEKIGIHVLPEGIYYKNINPAWKAEADEKYAGLAFYNTPAIFLSTKHFHKGDSLQAENHFDTLLMVMKPTANDYYPLLIGGHEDSYSLDSYTHMQREIPLFSLAIPGKLSNADRTDTLFIWLKPSSSLEAALPERIAMKDHLVIPDVEYMGFPN